METTLMFTTLITATNPRELLRIIHVLQEGDLPPPDNNYTVFLDDDLQTVRVIHQGGDTEEFIGTMLTGAGCTYSATTITAGHPRS